MAGAGPLVTYALVMEPQYESSGIVWVEEPKAPPSLFQDGGQQGRLPVLLTILGSRSLAASVADALSHKTVEELLQRGQHTDWMREINKAMWRLWGRHAPAMSPREQVALELLKARMTFTPKGNTGIVQITATASEPMLAKEIASAYIEVLRKRTQFFTREETQAVRQFLEEQTRQLQGTVREAEEDLLEYERRRGLVKLDDRVTQSLESLNQAEANLAAVIVSEDIARISLGAVKAQLEGKPAGRKVTEKLTVPELVRTLYERWQGAEKKVEGLTQTYTDAHPQVRAARGEAGQVWGRLDEALRQHLGIAVAPGQSPQERTSLVGQALTRAQEIGRAQAERAAHEERVGSLRAGLGSLSKDQYELARRRQALETARAFHALLARKTEEAKFRMQEELRNVQVLDPPSVPSAPSGRRALKVLLVALAFGFGMALGVPLGLELLDNTVKTDEEAEAALGWPVLGTIPAMELRPALAKGGRARALPASASGRKRPA
jgi:uncharacterized protein involved in exopolysaccharide biosynthesis